MGVIVKYTCQHCDFVADDVFYGPGFTTCQMPVLCQDCGSVVSCSIDESTNTLVEEYAHCSKCGSSNIVIWDHKCPECGSTDIDEEAVGMWD